MPQGQVNLPKAVNLSSVSLYAQLKKALECPAFMKDGGVLGFACDHVYVNSKLNDISDIPSLLKGTDSIIYSVAKALGIEVTVRPGNALLSNIFILKLKHIVTYIYIFSVFFTAVQYNLEEQGFQIGSRFPEEVIIGELSDDPVGWMQDSFKSKERTDITWYTSPQLQT